MFASVRRARSQRGSVASIDLAPLIDMVFILLIFFLVTTTFVTDAGIDVERPRATTGRALDPRSLRISITASGTVFIAGETVALEAVPSRVRQHVREEGNATVIVVPDASVRSDLLVRVLDQARLGGARDLAVATRPEDAP